MRKLATVLIITLLFIAITYAQMPSKIEVSADFMAQYFNNDFSKVLDYTAQGVDTIVLTTSGHVYTTTDTIPMVIENPVVIVAQEGLAEKPIFTHPNTGFKSGEPSSSMEIFRICNHVEFQGIAFRGDVAETEGCKYGLRYGDWTVPATGREIKGRMGTRMIFKNCDFIGFHSLKDQAAQGNALYYLKPTDTNLDHLKNTKVVFENCMFKDIGDEAIRITENEKYGGPNGVVACDSLVVKNCTFDDIDAECIRIYADLDTSQAGSTFVDGTIFVDHVTVVNSSPRFIYAKNFRNAMVQNVLIAYGREPGISRPDRGDYAIQIQLSGSSVAYVDTFNLVFTLEYNPRIGCTKGGYVDETTVYGYDPMFVDYENGDYTLASNSPLYWLSSDGTAIGDLRWATKTPTIAPLIVKVEGSGSVLFEPENTGFYNLNTVVTLTAVPEEGWEFKGWGGDLTGSDNPANVTIDGAKNITATFELSSGIKEESTPKEYRLAQNFPNPFNPTTTIEFDLKQAGWTTLSIYNILGQEVTVLVNKPMNAGWYTINFNASHLSSGIYYYRLKSGDFNSLKKMLLIK
ncbi:MAG TPA: T9SS type A sorting domain-containing protein [Candidatus Marinimicrobia bacterium]|nr:T9SS type A sorting domain-containing protein [Candidatus Neomarinimicrobiota bacterium]